MTAAYYQDEHVTLYHGDCREITDWLAAEVLVTDPPYGRDWRQGGLDGPRRPGNQRIGGKARLGIHGDGDTAVRDDALALWGTEKRGILFGDLMLPPPPGTKLVGAYLKPADAGIRGAMGGVRRDLEAIYLTGPWSSAIGGRSSLFTTAAPNIGGAVGICARGGHPHSKPQDVLGELMALTRPALSIADPFFGGGSIPVAARAFRLRCIAVEREERYCEIAARRLDQGVLDFGEASA